MEDTSGGGAGSTRPSVLDNASETQILELGRQSAEGDRQGWDALTGSYGWSDEQSNEVWDWFAQQPESGADSSGSGQ
ncbi:MAG TPA: hypothetical protein VND68_00520 [Chloroflexia bacterium]|jgi:hypothetical protein|nr:hypothetical protein [Chloroflexia bacterium]